MWVGDERLTRRSEGQRASLRARHIGLLLQGGNLVQHLTVDENVELAQRLAAEASGLTATGPDAATALRLVRTYA